jgi:hypothetical protein
MSVGSATAAPWGITASLPQVGGFTGRSQSVADPVESSSSVVWSRAAHHHHVANATRSGDGKEISRMLAYLDAASGSMIVQAIVAGAAGVAVFLKLFWRRLTSPFRSKSTSGEAQTPVEVGDKKR